MWPAWPVPPGGTLHLGHSVVRVGWRPYCSRPRNRVSSHLPHPHHPPNIAIPMRKVMSVTTVLCWESQSRNPYLTSFGYPWVPEPPPGALQVEVPGPAFTGSWFSRVAFLCWLLANVMLSMPVLVYGCHMLLATGIFQLSGLIFFSMATTLIPPCPLRMGTAILHFHRGPAFWITLSTGEAQPRRQALGELRAREGVSGTIILGGRG